MEDISTKNCLTEEGVFCNEPLTSNRIDYIFVENEESRLTRKETFHLPLETNQISGGVKYLSDHRAVHSVFETAFD